MRRLMFAVLLFSQFNYADNFNEEEVFYNPETDNVYSFMGQEAAEQRDILINGFEPLESNMLFPELQSLHSTDIEAFEYMINTYANESGGLPSNEGGETDDLSVTLSGVDSPRCGLVIRQLDLDNDGIKESYLEVSLLNCSGNNFVTSVKSQSGGTCQTYAATATLEMALAHELHRYRPISHTNKLLDFAPVNLSETMPLYGYSYTYIDTLKKNYGTNLEYYFPDATTREYFEQRDADTMSSRYASQSAKCHALSSRAEQKDCLFETSKQQQTTMFVPSSYKHIPSKFCLDTNDNNKRVACPTNMQYGRENDRYQIDYWSIDMGVISALADGSPVETSIKWRWDGNRTLRNIDSGDNRYDFQLVFPQPLANYRTNLTTDNAQWEDSLINNQMHNFWANHAVVIVGYLVGTNGKHYYIIKNSHGERGSQLPSQWGERRQERFVLVQTPGTSGPIDAADSTKRNLFIHSYSSQAKGFKGAGSNYTVIDQLSAGVMTTSVTKPADMQRSSNRLMRDVDQDGIIDIFDNCPTLANSNQADVDLDGVGDMCDYCPDKYDRYQKSSYIFIPGIDSDSDGIPNYCDLDLALPGPEVFDPEVIEPEIWEPLIIW